MKRTAVFILFTWLVVGGCATQTTLLGDPAVLQAFPAVAVLQAQLTAAATGDAKRFSPARVQVAEQRLATALQWGRAGNVRAEQFAREGLAELEKANVTAARARDIFDPVLQARSKALEAGARERDAAGFAQADQAFVDLINQFENGKEAQAKAGRAEVIASYAATQVIAVKGDTTDAARQAIATARKNWVEHYAPRTLKLADEELALAIGVLEADVNSRDKAEEHARNALYHVQRATHIAETIKVFKAEDYSDEQKVLWYQAQLEEALRPLTAELPFDRPNAEVLQEVHRRLEAQKAEYQALESKKAEAIAQLTLEKDALLSSVTDQAAREQAIADRFATVQTMFEPEEAEVYRQVDNILISAHGFRFASGHSEIEAENFNLLKKIIRAIDEFPRASVLVSGHTDSLGDDQQNRLLSQDRADKVARFLVQVGGISLDRVSAVGYGEDRPVANNETPEGRAANRRVEILIDNTTLR